MHADTTEWTAQWMQQEQKNELALLSTQREEKVESCSYSWRMCRWSAGGGGCLVHILTRFLPMLEGNLVSTAPPLCMRSSTHPANTAVTGCQTRARIVVGQPRPRLRPRPIQNARGRHANRRLMMGVTSAHCSSAQTSPARSSKQYTTSSLHYRQPFS